MKITFYSIIITIYVVSFLALNSCKKENTTTTQREISATDMRLATLIGKFKERGKSHLKSTAEMTVDSAKWFIGATTNFTYGNGGRITEKTWTDTCFITLSIHDSKVTENEVFNKYEILINQLRERYSAKSEENKQLICVQVLTENITSSELTCKVLSIFAYGTYNNAGYFNSDDSYNFWYDWHHMAFCGGSHVGSTAHTDAAEETQFKIQISKPIPMGNYWYDNDQTYRSIENPLNAPLIPGSSPTNHHYSCLYWNSNSLPDFDGCIPPSDLNFYLEKTKELIYNYEDNDPNTLGLCPQGYSFIDIDLFGVIDYSPQYGTQYYHSAKIHYGILHLSPFPPESLD